MFHEKLCNFNFHNSPILCQIFIKMSLFCLDFKKIYVNLAGTFSLKNHANKGSNSLAWRLGGDSSLRYISWRLAGSPSSRMKFKHVWFFGDFFSPQQVSKTSPWWERKPCFGLPNRRNWLVSAVVVTSPWWERKPFFCLPSRPSCRNWSVAATFPPVR